MRFDSSIILNKIIWGLTVILFAFFVIFNTYSWGKYAFLFICIAIIMFSMAANHGKIYINICAGHWLMLAFCAYTAITSLWAINSSDSIIMARTLLRITICSIMVYVHYAQKDNVESLLKAVKWAGYVLAIYTILFYGLVNLLRASLGATYRMQQEYANQNDIGMTIAISFVLQFAELVYDKKNWWEALFLIPSIIVVAATQSRNAFIMIVTGIVGFVAIKNWDNQKFASSFIKTLLGVAVTIAGIYLLSYLNLFTGIIERLNSMLSLITGKGEVDNSTLKRQQMMQIGIKYWSQYPILGIGMANPHIVAAYYIRDTYLHSNFIELLCGGGLMGTLLYYGMFIYIAYGLLKHQYTDRRYYSICLAWLVVMFIMDLGTVSYYEKSRGMYLTIEFINLHCLKKAEEQQKLKAQTDTQQDNPAL